MKISEVFSKINEEQKEVIKQISIMKSKENFETFEKNINFKIKIN